MTRDELNKQYFNWMYKLVCNKRYIRGLSFKKLLHKLNDISFMYTNPMDGNRACDGIDLRYRFGYENNYPEVMIATLLDDHECTVLEMMVALAFRCEEHIMSDPELGDRTGDWFWEMIRNMHIQSMNDSNYDNSIVSKAIDIMMNREYSKNGDGGLFTVNNFRKDLRDVEIWYQMCWHLDELE